MLENTIILSVIILFVNFFSHLLDIESPENYLSASNDNWGCILQIVGELDVMADREIDVNQDGRLDRIVLFIDEEPSYEPIFIIVALDKSPFECDVVLKEKLTASTLIEGRQEITVKNIEMVELTGDETPEIHINLDRVGGGPRASFSYHAIFTLLENQWMHVLGDTGIELCQSFNTFEFHEVRNKNIQEIYIDEDRHCEPPWSGNRTFNIMGWDGTKFTTIEYGTINKFSTNPPWINYFCFTIIIVPIVVLFIFFLRNRINQENVS